MSREEGAVELSVKSTAHLRPHPITAFPFSINQIPFFLFFSPFFCFDSIIIAEDDYVYEDDYSERDFSYLF
uniref:Uncharacterized protein MANES_16G131700 n=1 Tax=Rhizophora mucronata TaxID=61149 RepID=A0A2P2LP64_RHIMU